MAVPSRAACGPAPVSACTDRPVGACADGNSKKILSVLAALIASLLVAAAPAGADVFGSISLLSASPFEQSDYAHDPAISGNGRYVVFDGSIGGVTGVWRRENRPGGELVQVAGGDADLPSISQTGQYVSFTTNEGAKLPEITDGLPDPRHETGEPPNVYVRDMSREPGEAGAFTLASPLSYEYPSGAQQAFEQETYGSVAVGRTALSADGQKVVFVTTAASNLDGPGTPPLQVAVHDLETGKTELVSVEYDPVTGRPTTNEQTGQPEPVPLQESSPAFGAVYTAAGPPRFPSPAPYSLTPEIGASISADGSTVAWMGQNISEQAQTLPAESIPPKYGEPLWRRIVGAGGEPSEEAATRRVTGGSDPADPQCAAHPEGRLPSTPAPSDPCQGPFAVSGEHGVWSAGTGETIPRLSADGYTVAFLANAPLVSLGADFGVNTEGRHSDAYVVDMHEGLSRVQALTPLTELASGEETHIATNAPILDLGISPEGTQVAFTTKRTVFPLGSPAYVSVPAVIPGLSELFDVDLVEDTLTRVTHGYEGGPSEHPHQAPLAAEEDPYHKEDDGALAPSFSDNSELLAFSSTASNLVYGDGNTPPLSDENLDGSDVFGVNRIMFGATPTPQYVSSAPGISVAPVWELGVTALSLGDGSVLLYVDAPSAGTLSALVSSPIRTRSRRSSRATRRGRRKGSHARAAAAVLTRTVATATDRVAASGGGLTTLLLRLAPSYGALAAQTGGLSATANLTFTPSGHSALHQSIAVSFVRMAAKKTVLRRRSRAAGRTGSKARHGIPR